MNADKINAIVDDIYFETIGCPERSDPNYNKNIIKRFLLRALVEQCDEALDAINDPANKWDDTAHYNSAGIDVVIDRIINMIRNTSTEKLVKCKNDYFKMSTE
jgi:hypothetical protein